MASVTPHFFEHTLCPPGVQAPCPQSYYAARSVRDPAAHNPTAAPEDDVALHQPIEGPSTRVKRAAPMPFDPLMVIGRCQLRGQPFPGDDVALKVEVVQGLWLQRLRGTQRFPSSPGAMGRPVTTATVVAGWTAETINRLNVMYFRLLSKQDQGRPSKIQQHNDMNKSATHYTLNENRPFKTP